MGFVIRKVFMGVAGVVASYLATKWLEKLLEEKPFNERVEDAKTKIIDLQVKALDKKNELVNKAKDLVQKPAAPADAAPSSSDPQ